MSPLAADVVVCGAGIAGVSAAYHLTRHRGFDRLVVSDPRAPLTLTSDKSTECYRNWWPGPGDGMVSLMNRSIDLLEDMATESGDAFNMSRRGYLFLTADDHRLHELEATASAISRLGAGPLRTHRSDGGYSPLADAPFDRVPAGADLIADHGLLRRSFPWVAPAAVGGLHVRRAGWLSAQQLGAWMLEQARSRGAEVVRSPVVGVDVEDHRVTGVRLGDGRRIRTGALVNAAGPMVADVAKLVGVDLPVHSEAHHKLSMKDTAAAFPRDAPLTIWTDPQRIDWSAEERRILATRGRHDLLGELPPGCHGRPEGRGGSPWVLALWEYARTVMEPRWPMPEDDLYREVVIRGMASMIPAMGAYRDALPRTTVDGGYYTKTPENRPLIGPAGPRGSFVCGAFSGFGVMAAPGAGELLSLHVAGGPLPDHARWFLLSRYDDPEYRRLIEGEAESGQL